MQDVVDHYEQHPDDRRLDAGWGMLELARTREIISRHLPPPPACIADIGGGAGVHSAWLGELGYRTHLLDLAPGHVHRAGHKTSIRSAHLGDARHTALRDGFADAVLLLGPLYHLPDPDDRLRCLVEAYRVVRPGGLVFAAAICRFAPLLASLVGSHFDNPAFAPVLLRDLQTGEHRNTTGDPRRFTTAYFHRPEELVQEVKAAGFTLIELVPVEGASWLAAGSEQGFAECWAVPARRESLLQLTRLTEHDPMSLAVSPHTIAVVSRAE